MAWGENKGYMPLNDRRWLHTGQGFSGATEGLIFSYICPKRHILYTIWHFKIKTKVTMMIIIIEHTDY